MGLRPIYWARVGSGVESSDRFPDLIDLPGVGRTPDLVSVANALARRQENTTRTLYSNVSRVPGGHRVEVRTDGVVVTRTWPVFPRRMEMIETFDEAVTFARSALFAAVKRSLPLRGEVACEVSGGLDSSLIYAIARRIAATSRAELKIVPVGRLHVGRARCDESRFMEAMCGDVPDRIFLQEGPLDPKWFYEEAAACADLPGFPTDQANAPIYAEMMRRGITIALTGHGGDHMLGEAQRGGAEHLLRGQFAAAWHYQHGSLQGRASQIVRGDARLVARTFTRRPTTSPPDLMTEQVRRLVSRRDIPLAHGLPPGLRLRWRAIDQAQGFYFSSRSARRQTVDIDKRHPFFDPTFIEAMARIPQWLVGSNGDNRRLHRAIATDLLPAEVLERRGKAEFGELTYDLLAISPPITSPKESAARRFGWVDADRIESLWRAVVSESNGMRRKTLPLWNVVRLDAWTSTFESNS
jgi:asparagine synthase (glutamine-hydrolysing)